METATLLREEMADDVYIDVQRREEGRKKQGLPPRVGIFSHSAVAEEERCRETRQGRKKRTRKRSSDYRRKAGATQEFGATTLAGAIYKGKLAGAEGFRKNP